MTTKEKTLDERIDDIQDLINKTARYAENKIRTLAKKYTQRPDIVLDVWLDIKPGFADAKQSLRKILDIQKVLGAKVQEAERLEKKQKEYKI